MPQRASSLRSEVILASMDIAAAVCLLRRAVHLGINFIDTADAYAPDVSENLLARALYPSPADLVIATKGGLLRPAPGEWVRDGRPVHLRAACEASLKRLRLERIDLYQLHAVDPAVPIEESVGELARLRTEGKVRHIGLSTLHSRSCGAVSVLRPWWRCRIGLTFKTAKVRTSSSTARHAA